MWKKIEDQIIRLYYNEAMRYLFIGGCTTLVNLLISHILWEYCGWSTFWGNLTSIVCSILFAYVTNKLFVFSSKTESLTELFWEFVRFVGGRMATMVIEIGGVQLAVDVLGQPKMVGKVVTQVIVIIGNFFISKFLVFRGEKKKEEKEQGVAGVQKTNDIP